MHQISLSTGGRPENRVGSRITEENSEKKQNIRNHIQSHSITFNHVHVELVITPDVEHQAETTSDRPECCQDAQAVQGSKSYSGFICLVS